MAHITLRHLLRLFPLLLLLWGGRAMGQQAHHPPAQHEPPKMPVLPPQLMPPHPPAKMEARYFKIDAKRLVEDPNGDDALPVSREFKRIDSTYYVGWMFEGAYKYTHAADYLGYRNAAAPLERALDLLEHDYAKALSTRTGDVLVFYPVRMLAPDYTLIANYLMNCYSNTDQPGKVFKLLRRVLRWHLQADYYMDAYNYLAWTVHRNRFYTSMKYPFLKNTIDQNEALAQRYLDTSMRMIARNKSIDDQLGANVPFMRDIGEREKISVYHYRNILYSYNFQIDSAEYYFDLMRKAGRLPHNNYGNFKVICGDFRTAEAEYRQAATQDGGDKRLQEWAYYSSIIDIYKAKPVEGAEQAQTMIKAAGTTPGYGWYNIALARCLSYDGQLKESAKYIDKAADFKEVHIGTTLGQSQYEFSVQLVKLLNKSKEQEMLRFEHANWWYNPSILWSMAQKMSDHYLQQFLIINQFIMNPERDRVIYKLFSTESTVSWDEIWYLIHDYGNKFFINKFEKEAEQDSRVAIRKYFRLFTARLMMQQGKYKEAKKLLDRIITDSNTDQEYEKLFMARICEAQAICARELHDEKGQSEWTYKLCTLYPQLVPFTGLKANMELHLSGEVDKGVVERLKACNIHWEEGGDPYALAAYVQFSHQGKNREITYYVLDKAGNFVTPKQTCSWQQAGDAGRDLAYKLFRIGSKVNTDKE